MGTFDRIINTICEQGRSEMTAREKLGFALPTVLIASVVLLTVLVAAISTTTAISSQLREQNYLRHAGLAAEAGEAFKKACLVEHAGSVTWSDSKPLRPNTDCSGTVDPDKSAYVLDIQDEGFRTYFVVDSSLRAKGYTEALRASTGVAWRIWTDTASAMLVPDGASLPVGSYIEGAWTTAPEGFLLADGAAVSRTTYANLFAVIGTTYGEGNGSTTFNLPNTNGRVTVARTTSSSVLYTDQDGEKPFDTLGEISGRATHTLTKSQMPSHRHAMNLYPMVGFDSTGGARAVGGDGSAVPTSPVSVSAAPVEYEGGSESHNNVQPSIVVNRAIKY